MRIVAGKYRRRTLLPPAGEQTRPITDRAKEQLFENLGGELHGERVLDAFAGTGTIGLEALSRGASGCVFLEGDKRTHGLLQENVAKLGAGDVSICWRVDILRTSFKARDAEGLMPFDLLFFDPPYKMAPTIGPGRPLYRSLERVAKPEISSEEAELIVRVPVHEEVTLPPVWAVYRELKVGGMKFLMCDRADSGEPDGPHDPPPPASEAAAGSD